MEQTKTIVDKETSFDLLDIRLGRVVSVSQALDAPKKSYLLEIDFGKFGRRRSVARFTSHPESDLLGRQVVAVLNFPPRQIGATLSECLVLGVQYPKAESGEATFLTLCAEAKIGGKVF